MKEFLNQILIETDGFVFRVTDLLMILAIMGAAILLNRTIRGILRRRFKAKGGKAAEEGKLFAIKRLVSYAIYSIAIILSLEAAGLDVTLLIAGSTALLVGIGFGLQNTFNDLVSGIILLFEGTTQVNDIIEINELLGKVTRIGMRTSVVETQDNISIIVPNSKLISDKVINWSHNRTLTRFHIDIGVAYGTDPELVNKTLVEVALSHSEVNKDPKPFVWFKDFGDSALQFQLYYHSMNRFYNQRVKSDLRFAIDKAFRENNIRIPFPQRDLHLVSGNFNAKAPEEESPTQ